MASFDVAASARDVLLATKLHLPRVGAGFVARPRLLDQLDETSARGLVLVCAPAGFGKTALLADWARLAQTPVAWLSLDAGDSDPARFWRHVVAALDQALPGIAETVAPWLGPPAPPSYAGLVTALINDLTDGPADAVRLVLDDYHLIDSPRVHESVMFLIDHLPPTVRLVLAGRADPPLAFARLRVRGQLTELRAADLRFTADEVAVVLHSAGAPELPASAVTALSARTEGWAAGLHLAALSLRGQPDAAAFVTTFNGTHRYILDYLTEEVLDRQGDQVRGFLLETSLLDRVSGPLCDAVTGRSDSQAMLETIEADGLFLLPLDEVRGWWRYHHLFADLLRARLQHARPDRVMELHAIAAGWHEQHGLADDAVRHAIAAGESAWAATLIEQHFDELFYVHGEPATVTRWLSLLPTDFVRTRQRLLVAQAAIADADGRIEDVEELLTAAEGARPDAAGEAFVPSAGPAASLLVNVAATVAIFRSYLAALRGDADAAAAYATTARAGIGAGQQMLDFISQGTSAVADWSGGRAAQAERTLSSSLLRWQQAGHGNLIGWGGYHLGQIQRALGQLDAAQATYRRTLESTAAPGHPALPAAGIGYAGLAELAYERNDLDAARRLITDGIALCRQFSFTPPLAGALATLAWTRMADGDTDGALQAMTEAAQASPRSADADLLNQVPARRARLLLAQGDVPAAHRWTQERGLAATDEPDYPKELAHLVLARVLLAQDQPERALPLLQKLHASAASQGRVGSAIEARALQALAFAAYGDDAAAVEALAEALTRGAAGGYVRLFVDEGAPMQALLGRLVASQRSDSAAARQVPLEYLARLLRAFDSTSRPPSGRSGAAVSALIDPLTPREVEVLDLLAAGKSNRHIAAQLVVTLDTVKKHVSHVLDKLGATNRTEAVARGRALGLIG